MTRVKRLLSGLISSAITEPGLGGSRERSVHPTEEISANKMRVDDRVTIFKLQSPLLNKPNAQPVVIQLYLSRKL